MAIESEALSPAPTSAQVQVAEIWAELLGQAATGPYEDFFGTGGDSIMASALVARVRTRLGVDISLSAFVNEPTVAALAARIEEARARNGMAAASPEDLRSPVTAARCSYAQERFWFIHQASGGNAVSNVSWALRLRGAFEVPLLRRAMAALTARHDSLRTRFEMRDGHPVQVVEASCEPHLTLEDVSNDAEARSVAAREAAAPFDLSRGALLRVQVLRLGPDEHVVHFIAHHIICDDWSKGVIMSELGALYEAFKMGEAPDLPAPSSQYPAYSEWQRDRLDEEVLRAELEHWQTQLEGAPPALELPTDRPRPPARTMRGARVRTPIAAELASSLRRIGQEAGATFFMTMLAAFEALLHRYTGQTDLIVGTAVDNRGRVELERAVGLFTNVLALRADLSDRPSFRELLRRARARTLDAVAHQDLPFDRLAATVPERDPGRHPIFQAFYEFIVPAPLELPISAFEMEPFEVAKHTAEFDLGLYLDEQRGGLDAVWEYSSELFERSTIERIARHFVRMLEGIVADPDRPLAELELLDDGKRRRVLEEWNATAHPVPSACIDQLFEAQARSTPDAPAVVAGGVELTYSELNARANQVAHLLREQDVGAGEAVGISLDRSVELVAAMLGALKAGAAYVPLNPDHPPARLAAQLSSAAARVLISDHELPGYQGRIVRSEEQAGLPQNDLRRVSDPEGLAYVLYTSGSTGAPKGVTVTHRNVANYTAHMLRVLGSPAIEEESSCVGAASGLHFASVSSFSTDLGNTAIFPALLGGGCLHLLGTEVTTDAARFTDYLARRPIDVLKITPSHLSSLLDGNSVSAALPRRWLVLGGEGLSWELAERVTVPGGPRVLNHYGPTEATIGCCIHELDVRAERPPSATVPIGRPISNARAYVLDPDMAPAPVGVPGELYVGGCGVARGYLEASEQTAQSFIADPFTEDRTARLYRTGDLARFLPDGSIEFLGRIDQQVKIRGFRVEPAEVQAALMSEQGVKQAAVLAVGAGEGKRLAAYVTSGPQGTTPEILRTALEQSLPAYMVPASITMLDSLPLTPNGKLDHAALRSIEDVQAEPREGEAEPPLGEMEGGLASIWSELLEREVGVDDNFFEIGGHSLLAIRLIARIRNELGTKLSLKALIDAPTIRELATRVQVTGKAAPAPVSDQPPAIRSAEQPPPTIGRAPRDRPLRCSFAQEQLWLVDQLTPGSAAYNFSWPMRLTGALDPDALARAVAEVGQRHEALRTRFVAHDGQPFQIVERSGVAMRVVDLTDEPDPEAAAVRLIDEQTQAPFDLVRGPLVRVQLLRLGELDHVLQIVVHHIVFDGVSKLVLYRELGELYEAFAAGSESPLSEPELQYADCAEWQRSSLDDSGMEDELAHWRKQLEGAPTALDLPTDRPRPPVANLRGARYRRPVPAELREAIETLARAEGATFFMAVLAVFDVLLYRYTGQDEILVGTPVDTRSRPELEQVLGPFINTVVVRGEMSGRPSFRELLGRVRQRTLEAIEHQDLPFERLVEALAPERDLSRHPLFQALLALNPPESGLSISGVSVADIDPAWSAARVDLFLVLDDLPHGLDAVWEYSTDLFDAETIERMAGHFLRLLEEVVADPDRAIDELPLLDHAERATLIEGWNRTGREIPDARLEQLVAEQARVTIDRVAVEFEGRTVTYGELDARANQLAHRLQGLGAGPDELVGICLPRSEELLVALLATMKAGSAYVPIDPTFPANRQRFMLADAGARVLVTQEDLRGWLPADRATVLYLDRDRDEIAREPTTAPVHAADSTGLAYVIYTSGSTGRPKGVEIQHRALVNFLASMRERPGLTASDVLVAVTTLSFDIAGLELYLPLVTGARVVIASAQTSADPRSLGRLIDTSGATVMQATPTTWRMLLDSGWRNTTGLKALCGGEALPPALADELIDTGLELWNMYGPTETTIWSMVEPLRNKDGRPSIGRPIANTTLYVLDAQCQPTPIGVPGELHIGGAGLARGYLNRPELTAERFIADPLSSEPDARLYKTGDLVRHRPDGKIEFLGRIDQQVKLRGHRIELGEIEATLVSHPGVSSAAARLNVDGVREPMLVAYVVPEHESVDEGQLRRLLSQSLPAYMVPSRVVTIERLPLTPNGKLDRDALPSPTVAAAHRANAYVAPRTQTEAIVASQWVDVLGVERVGIEDDFFDLGGQSLLAARLVSRLDERFTIELPLRAVFEASTVAGLAERIDSIRATEADAPTSTPNAAIAVGGPTPPTEAGPQLMPTSRSLPASFAQEGLWFVDQMSEGAAAYNISWPLRLSGSLDVVALERALGDVVRRHEVLRTRFATEGGRPMQVIDPAPAIPLQLIDLSASQASEVQVRRLIDQQTQEPFDIERGPLARAALIRLGSEEHILQLVVHHIIADGWSKVILLRDLGTLYNAIVENRPAALPELAVQYAAFAEWERAWLQDERLEQELAYWRGQLTGIPSALELPADRPRPATAGLRGGWWRTSIGIELRDALGALARREGATLFMVVLAAFDVLLYRYTGQDDVLVGTPVDTRRRAELEQLIGPFVNTVVMRGDLSGAPSFRDLLGRVRERTLDAMDHQDLPFERLVEALAPHREVNRHPLVQAILAFNAPEPGIELHGLRTERFETDKITSRVDLSLILQQDERGLEAVWEYSADLFDHDTVQQMAGHFLRLLESIAADPDESIDELNVLDKVERAELLAASRETQTSFPVACMHELFEAQAAKEPDAVALVCEGETLSYRELNERANRLAHRLRELGVVRETLVALCLERSPELVVAIIAVLKAGGAYVPLDPEYPADRLAFVLRDCEAQVLLTQERLMSRLPAHEAHVVVLDRPDHEIATQSALNPDAVATPENLAYVIYTSGSTGQPKGVQVEHGQIARLFSATERWYGFGPHDTWTLAHSYAFDFSVWELWGPLAYGGRIVVCPFWVTRSPEALAALVAEERVTVLSATPSLFTSIQADLLRHSDELVLRTVVFGGEALHPATLRPWFDCFGDTGATLVNMYGITETTVHTSYRVIEASDCDRDTSPIGVPIPDLSLYLLDKAGEPVPSGVPGELYVGGAGVTRGYLNRAELNQQRFLPNPFGPGRLYRSGDLARRGPDGELAFLGRMDDQVKVRGFRIELGEVQAALLDHEAVAECAVLPVTKSVGDVRLAAYVVPDEQTAPVTRRLLTLEREGRLSADQVQELPNGMLVAHRNRTETDYLYEDIFAEDRYLRHGIAVPANACVFDVGANIGMFSLRVAIASAGARIFAFEPIPPVFELLRLNAQLHSLNATLFDFGLARVAGTGGFTYLPHNTLISGRYLDLEQERDAVRQKVDDSTGRTGAPDADEILSERMASESFIRPLKTISQVIAEHGIERIDLLKIDAEKSESEILAGIEECDWPKISQLVLEVHGSPAGLVSELVGRGFIVDSEDGNMYARRGSVAAAVAVDVKAQSPARLSSQLRESMRAKLPEYMVPSSFTILDELPLTANGKLDRRALPAPEEERLVEDFTLPRTDTERAVAALWRELLGAERFGIDDDFFTVGGHSLLAAQLAARLRERLEARITVRDVFEQPTVRGLGRRIEESGVADAVVHSAEREPLTRRPPGERWPLSHAQEQLWLIDQWDPGAPTYNVALPFHIQGPLDLDALRAALAGLLSRHEILRTVIAVEDDHPVPVLLEDPTVDLTVIDLPGASSGELTDALKRLASRPFDFSADALLRGAVIRLDEENNVLLVQTHHIALDGWSERVLLDELGALYLGRALPEPSLQYGDFARWERASLRGEVLEKELAFWRRHLADAPTSIDLPADHPRPAGRRFAGAVHELALPQEAATAALSLCRDEDVTPYMLVLGALTTTLYRITGQDDILVGSPMANRESVELERLIGFFSNTLVFRSKLGGNPTFRELLARVREMALDVYTHQGVAFEKVVEAVRPEREEGVNPLFQVNLRVRDTDRASLELPGAAATRLSLDVGFARFDFALDLEVLGRGVTGYFRYNRDIFEPETIARISDEFVAVMHAVLADPDRRLLALALRHEWNGAGRSGAATADSGLRGFRARRVGTSSSTRG